jgi:serine/threonine protein kinase
MQVIDRRYRIEQLLGKGGTGTVCRALDLQSQRHVAIKVVRAEHFADADARERFHREAQVLARLRHPSIVSILDDGSLPDGGAYVVMELVRGEDLRRLLLREGRVAVPRALGILSAVCGAIEAAHREGILHRDLKPENILLPDEGVAAQVLDFGVARVVRDPRDDQHTPPLAPSLPGTTGVIVGTPAYMAPEQARGLEPDPRSDIFSLGAIAFEMLTGTLPFGRGSLAEVVLAHARGVPRFPGDARIPIEIEDAVRAALDPDPDRRPPTAERFELLLTAQ